MLRISEEEYRALELRIQTEVHKIFVEFLEDLKRKNAGHDETATVHELQKSDHMTEPEPVKSIQTPAKTRKRRASKKATEMNRLLKGTKHVRPKSSGNILEEDMDKIFRRRYRRGSG